MKHVIVYCITLVLILVNVSCEQNAALSVKGNKSTETTIKSGKNFWGTWIKMSDGTEYVINETTCSYADKTKNFTEANRRFLTVSGLGTFEKQSNAVMVMDSIPYYRKGGADLEYSIKIVGFVDSRADQPFGLFDKKVECKSNKYKSFIEKTKTDKEGFAHLTAPIVNDIQSVTVEDDNGTSVTVNDLKIEHSGANMGTIALVKEGQYNLKVTGTIDDKEKMYDDKPNGYLYAHKEYPIKLTITNISKVPATAFMLNVEATHPSVTVESKDGLDLKNGVLVSTLAAGGTKSLNLGVTCGDIDTGRIDTEIKIKINNGLEDIGWEDCIPLRFHRGTQCFTINALSTDLIEEDAVLNGFIIYPDGNNQFFSVNYYEYYETIQVPEFNSDEPYRLVFCGARANSGLGSTEMSYTVIRGKYPLAIEVIDNNNYKNYLRFGEPNNTESSAFSVLNYFQAYLAAEGDIDYFDMTVNDEELPFVTLDNQGGLPSFYMINNYKSGDDLVAYYTFPEKKGWSFDGYWSEPNGGGEQYSDKDGKEVKTWPISDKITLYAKWISPKIGDIMYSDMSFSASYETGKTPLGVVFDVGDKIKIIELQEASLAWCLATADGYDRDLATSISDGSVNWETICKTVSDEETAGNYPAFEYAIGNGWYMPAKNELNTIYTHKTAINSSLTVLSNAGVSVSLLTGNYWSSTSYSESRFPGAHAYVTASGINGAWYQNFGNGTQGTYYKTTPYKVRAVKAF